MYRKSMCTKWWVRFCALALVAGVILVQPSLLFAAGGEHQSARWLNCWQRQLVE